MIRIASYNVENLFARPKVFNPTNQSSSKQILNAYKDVNNLFSKAIYSNTDKQRIRDLLVELDIYRVTDNGAIRRNRTQSPKWAWLRKNRGKFDKEPIDKTKNVEITADGRSSWLGWVALVKEPANEITTRMTARVIQDVNADIIGIVEADDRPSLVRFNKELLNNFYRHVMLVDGNDERGIDVAIMTKDNFEIESIRSNVDTEDHIGPVFSRDCPQYEIKTPSGAIIHVLINHFKSQSGGGGPKRKRQAKKLREIVNSLVAQGKHVVVLGDFNEGPKAGTTQAENLTALYDNDTPLIECYSLSDFQAGIGKKIGTYDSCGITNRLDYIFISKSLESKFKGGEVFRKGLWGSRKTRPTDWPTYNEITKSSEQASDHAIVVIELDI